MTLRHPYQLRVERLGERPRWASFKTAFARDRAAELARQSGARVTCQEQLRLPVIERSVRP